MSSAELGFEDSLADIVSPGDVVGGKYRVDRVIGTGGMGIVVEAFHLHFEERVAIKFLVPQMGANEEALARFEREARAAFKIKSEHVARVIDVGKLNGKVPYMVMEFLEGTDLGVMLTDRRAFPLEDSVEFVLQAIEAVAEAHTLQIVHRDLKPENLFLTKRADGTPCIKVLDFGLSKALTPEPAEQRPRALTGTAQVMGTPQYMSPEQWMSARDVGAATDQWALGVILYELVTGLQPFDQEQLAQLCTQVLRSEPDPIGKHRPNVPPALEEVILRCLRKEPKDRFVNVGELALALLPFAPARVRQTVKRIIGVFKRVGVDPGEIPPSARSAGLGHNMVLGRPQHQSQSALTNIQTTVAMEPGTGAALAAAAIAEAAAPPQPAPQAARSPSGPPRPAAPIAPPRPSAPRGNGPPSVRGGPPPPPSRPRPSVPVAPPPGPPASMAEDLAATRLFSRDPPPSHTAALQMLGPTPVAHGAPPGMHGAPPATDAMHPAPGGMDAVPASQRTAVLSSPFPQLQAHGSGQWSAQPPPSQPYTMATAPQAPMADMNAYGVPQPPAGMSGPFPMTTPGYAPPVAPMGGSRAITAQSWQNMLDVSNRAQASREKRVVFAVVGAVVACVAIAIFLLVGVSSGASPDPGAEPGEPHAAAATDDDLTARADVPPSEPRPASDVAPAPSPPASESSASSAPAVQPTAHAPVPRGRRLAPPRPPPRKDKKGKIFDSRN